jgi:hypothetical protein
VLDTGERLVNSYEKLETSLSSLMMGTKGALAFLAARSSHFVWLSQGCSLIVRANLSLSTGSLFSSLGMMSLRFLLQFLLSSGYSFLILSMS